MHRTIDPSNIYRGVVERVLCDRFILKFKNDFCDQFKADHTYSAAFHHNRIAFQRKHAAVTNAKKKFGKSFLFPKRLRLAENLQFDAKLNGNTLVLNGKRMHWFRQLNEEQQRAVVGALRGESRPYPFVIFGPPVSTYCVRLFNLVKKNFRY